MLFGAIVAFAFLAVQPTYESSLETSTELVDFLDSQEKSKIFSKEELRAGVSHIILKCSSRGTGYVTVPIAPSILTSGKYLEVGVPVAVQVFSENVKLWSFVSLSFDDGEVTVKSARIGNARLPLLAARKLAKSIFGFYTPIKSLEKYIDISGKSKIKILPDGDIRIEK